VEDDNRSISALLDIRVVPVTYWLNRNDVIEGLTIGNLSDSDVNEMLSVVTKSP